MTLVVVIMCYSLTKIHKTLKNLPFLKQKINLNRMVAHSLAYIIYLVTYFVYKLLSQFKYDGDQYPYLNVTWFALTIVATIQFVAFWFILWHLGTKEKPMTINVSQRNMASSHSSVAT